MPAADPPLAIYALAQNDNVRDVTITMLQFERSMMTFSGVGIFEDQEVINSKVLARLSDVCEKQFSSLDENRERIVNYVRGAVPTES